MINSLYCDGGVILRNPSPIGGTYAYRILCRDIVVSEGARFLSCRNAQTRLVTNNMTEMMALVKGLEQLPDDWYGTIYSDSQITLGRVFLGWKWKNIPDWLSERFEHEWRRLVLRHKIKYVLLAGHPSKAQLEVGIGKHGLPVSEHNVWCDEACRKAGEEARGHGYI